jgi:hypothetical protein
MALAATIEWKLKFTLIKGSELGLGSSMLLRISLGGDFDEELEGRVLRWLLETPCSDGVFEEVLRGNVFSLATSSFLSLSLSMLDPCCEVSKVLDNSSWGCKASPGSSS